MTQRQTTPPTVNKYGAEEHPAFGMIRAGRVSGSARVVFDSDITHQHTVRITISTADRKRDLNHDWIHEGKQLIEVELSEAQWASFVSSMNTSGVPATLRWTAQDGQLPELDYAPRLAKSMDEVKDAAAKTFARIAEALADYEQAVEQKAGAKALREKLRTLHFTVKNTEGNLSFAAESLNEYAEDVVQKARADIEAMVYHEATRLGLTPGEAQGLVELPALPGEVEDDVETLTALREHAQRGDVL